MNLGFPSRKCFDQNTLAAPVLPPSYLLRIPAQGTQTSCRLWDSVAFGQFCIYPLQKLLEVTRTSSNGTLPLGPAIQLDSRARSQAATSPGACSLVQAPDPAPRLVDMALRHVTYPCFKNMGQQLLNNYELTELGLRWAAVCSTCCCYTRFVHCILPALCQLLPTEGAIEAEWYPSLGRPGLLEIDRKQVQKEPSRVYRCYCSPCAYSSPFSRSHHLQNRASLGTAEVPELPSPSTT